MKNRQSHPQQYFEIGIIGYYVTYQKIRQHRNDPQLPTTIHKYWVHAYTCFCAILGLGYNRFMYPSDYVAWRAGVAYPLTAFFTSRILFTLLAMGVILVPVSVELFYVEEVTKRIALSITLIIDREKTVRLLISLATSG